MFILSYFPNTFFKDCLDRAVSLLRVQEEDYLVQEELPPHPHSVVLRGLSVNRAMHSEVIIRNKFNLYLSLVMITIDDSA